MGYRLKVLFALVVTLLACRNIPGVEFIDRPQTEIVDSAQSVPTAQPQIIVPTQPIEMSQPQPVLPEATPTATLLPTATPEPTPTTFFLQTLSSSIPPYKTEFPRHGIILAILAFFCIMAPWLIGQVWFIQFSLPKSTDVTEVLIKGQDGLFITAVLSMTARRSFTFTALFARWGRIREVVSKAVEQKLIQSAMRYETIEKLVANLQIMTDELYDEPIVKEIWTDFGVRVTRFNIETRYPDETRDAINRKAEAVAGGQAYLAYANAAHLDPESSESRELYGVYQRTTSQVDAARNLGGGITDLATVFGQRTVQQQDDESDG